jgi:hypothetical protein
MAEDLFHDIIDPYESTIQNGREDGRNAGLQAGYNDGYQIGKLKAYEIGIELGYMSSICSMALQLLEKENKKDGGNGKNNGRNDGNNSGNNNDSTNKKLSSFTTHYERKRKRLMDLIDAIQAFPKPESIFNTRFDGEQNKNNDNTDKNGNDDLAAVEKNISLHNDIEYDHNHDQIDSLHNKNVRNSDVDIVSIMQRLRAKFKTILVQLNLSHLRLKDVMDGSVKMEQRNNSTSNKNGGGRDQDIIDRIDEW